MLFCVSGHKDHVSPPKGEFFKVLQKEINPERISIGAFFCSWDGDLAPTELGRRDPEPPTTTRDKGPRTKETIYLTEWIKVGSAPQLVIYDRGSSANIIAGELGGQENLEILSARAGRVRVAGGQQISTDYGVY